MLFLRTRQGDGAFDFLAEEERASKHAKGRLDPGFNEQQMAVLEDTEVLVGQRDAEINNIGTPLPPTSAVLLSRRGRCTSDFTSYVRMLYTEI